MNKPVAWEIQCGGCKWREQGQNCGFCSHPKQPNEDFKSYVYYNFSCELGEKGMSDSVANVGYNILFK